MLKARGVSTNELMHQSEGQCVKEGGAVNQSEAGLCPCE